MFSKDDFERLTSALDVAEGCISAAVCGSNYGIRLKDTRDSLIEIVDLFKPEEDRRKHIALVFLELVNGNQITGIQSLDFTKSLNWARERVKGKLLGTRMIMSDNDAKRKSGAAGRLARFKASELG